MCFVTPILVYCKTSDARCPYFNPATGKSRPFGTIYEESCQGCCDDFFGCPGCENVRFGTQRQIRELCSCCSSRVSSQKKKKEKEKEKKKEKAEDEEEPQNKDTRVSMLNGTPTQVTKSSIPRNQEKIDGAGGAC